MIGWLPTSQTSLITSPQPQIEKVVTPPPSIPPLSESQQKISISPAVIEKLPSILESIALQKERSESTLKLLKDLEEKFKPIANLDNQLKQQNEQQVANTQSILEQIKNIQGKVNNQSVLEQLQQIHEEVKSQSHRGIISDRSVTSLSEKYLTIGIFIISLILVIGIILWWLLYHRMNKLSGYSQFTEINQGLVRNTDALQSLNTITIKGLEETKGVVGLTIERNTNELREYLLKRLTEMTQGMNSFFAQSSQHSTKDFSEFRENVSNQLVSNKTEMSQLLTSNNQNLQTTFTNFSDKTVLLLMNSLKTTNESLQSQSKEIKESFSNLNEKVVSDLGSIQTNLASNLGSLNQGINRSFAEFNEKIVGSQIEMRQTMADSISTLNEKVLNELGGMRTHLVYSTAESVQSQSKAMEEFRDKVGVAVESSLKNNADMLNNMFAELRNTTQNHLQLMNQKVEERLNKGFEKNNEVFINVIERLQQIDIAQQKISELSGNVVTLQKTLDSKGARGAFGEVQLVDLVRDAFPDKYVKFQHTLKNGKRPDCLLLLPPPTGNIAIDAKFPLENYLAMVNRDFTDLERASATKNFKRDIKKHIIDISDKYIIPSETADGAMMFIPSEAVFAEIHAHHSDVVQEAQNRRVWITSPTTLMAVLTTARAVLADAERNKQAQIIHQHLISLSGEFTRFNKRMDDLSRHIGQANDDVEKITITAKKITDKFSRIEKVELEESIPALTSEMEDSFAADIEN